MRARPSLAAADRKYASDPNLPWKEEQVKAVGPDVGSFYDGVYDSLRKRKPFRIQAGRVREMMRLIDLCRKQNPRFMRSKA